MVATRKADSSASLRNDNKWCCGMTTNALYGRYVVLRNDKQTFNITDKGKRT
jgi:hypothetical protein